MEIENRMASVQEAQIIEKLSSIDYSNWKFEVEMLLIKEGLFEAITETPPTQLPLIGLKKTGK